MRTMAPLKIHISQTVILAGASSVVGPSFESHTEGCGADRRAPKLAHSLVQSVRPIRRARVWQVPDDP